MGRPLIAAALLLPLLLGAAPAGAQFRPPGPRDRCPVCGMFVAKFPAWTAELVFADGTYAAFDGVRDLVRHRAAAGPDSPEASAAVFVTDYYRLEPVDGRAAWYVSGSDVLGPMGAELIAFASEEEAREFLRDHRGAGVHRFEDLPALVGGER
jgi:nitrous oxide reductase accessory protein NosL